jgi:hypothetical protein
MAPMTLCEEMVAYLFMLVLLCLGLAIVMLVQYNKIANLVLRQSRDLRDLYDRLRYNPDVGSVV